MITEIITKADKTYFVTNGRIYLTKEFDKAIIIDEIKQNTLLARKVCEELDIDFNAEILETTLIAEEEE